MRLRRMRTGISITVTPSDRLRLEALVRDRNAPQKQVWRAEIVLLSADGVGTNEIKRRTGKSKTCVWRWQERFAREGFEGLLRDKTRPPRVAPLGAEHRGRADQNSNSRTHRVGAIVARRPQDRVGEEPQGCEGSPDWSVPSPEHFIR